MIWNPEEFRKGAPDEEWIPKIASKHGVVLTQDLNMHRTRAQWELCKNNKIGEFFFKPPKAGWSYWVIVREVVYRWEEIKNLATKSKRPFGYVVELRRKSMIRL